MDGRQKGGVLVLASLPIASSCDTSALPLGNEPCCEPRMISLNSSPTLFPLSNFTLRAGADGIARYPLLLLSPDVKWHPEVRPGGMIRQTHDRHLLDDEFLEDRMLI